MSAADTNRRTIRSPRSSPPAMSDDATPEVDLDRLRPRLVEARVHRRPDRPGEQRRHHIARVDPGCVGRRPGHRPVESRQTADTEGGVGNRGDRFARATSTAVHRREVDHPPVGPIGTVQPIRSILRCARRRRPRCRRIGWCHRPHFLSIRLRCAPGAKGRRSRIRRRGVEHRRRKSGPSPFASATRGRAGCERERRHDDARSDR